MRLYLIRHAQTSWNREGRAQGHSDIPLDEEGLQQSYLLGARFRGETIDAVLSSDLLRCRQTAQCVADSTGAPIEHLTELRERSFGEWEGMKFDEIQQKLWGDDSVRDPFGQVPPGGESFRMVWGRLEPVASRLARMRGSVVVVTHGGSCALLLARLMRGTIETSRSFRFANTAVTTLVRREDGLLRLDSYNDTAHLNELALAGDLDGTHR